MADNKYVTGQEEEQVLYRPMPMIGDKAPSFRSMTTMGKINFPEDYKGKWVVFFSHPADFTPVCTTEFIALAKRAEEFKKYNAELLGLSIDSVHSHLAWADSIEKIDWQGEGAVKIPFPIVADISMNVSKKYGMLQTVARTQTVRAVFLIDPESVIRCILYYPMSTGRNIDEIVRVLLSLQKHDRENISTPANWNPGQDVVLGAPLTLEEAKERMSRNDTEYFSYDWYLTVKKDTSVVVENGAHDAVVHTSKDALVFKTSPDAIWMEDETGFTVAQVNFTVNSYGQMALIGTFVSPEYRNKGIASALMEATVARFRKYGIQAILYCSFAIRWFAAHPECHDVLLDPEGVMAEAADLGDEGLTNVLKQEDAPNPKG